MNVNFHQIRAFSLVAQEGSFSAAARRLGLSQSAVTQHVSHLESLIGTHLFVRTHGGVELTRTGRDFSTLSQEFMSLEQVLADKIERYAKLESGYLNVIANAPQPALRAIEAFHKITPGVEVAFSLFDWTTSVTLLQRGEVDAAFVTSPPTNDEFYTRDIDQARFVLYCRKDHRLNWAKNVSLEDLEREVLLLPEDGSLTRKIVRQAFRKAGLKMHSVVKTTTFPVMKEAILQGVGVGIFLNQSASSEDRLVEIPIREIPDVFTTSLVVPKSKLEHRVVQNFASACQPIEKVFRS
ncbi:MAG: LysR family transcriptional regulator [Pseudomonadota bacterium]